MSYTRTVGNMVIHIICIADSEGNREKYGKYIEEKIIKDGYIPKTSLEHLVDMIILYFDCDDNYGEYDEETGFGGYGGYGDGFSLEECFRYVEESGGYREFDYYC